MPAMFSSLCSISKILMRAMLPERRPVQWVIPPNIETRTKWLALTESPGTLWPGRGIPPTPSVQRWDVAQGHREPACEPRSSSAGVGGCKARQRQAGMAEADRGSVSRVASRAQGTAGAHGSRQGKARLPAHRARVMSVSQSVSGIEQDRSVGRQGAQHSARLTA